MAELGLNVLRIDAASELLYPIVWCVLLLIMLKPAVVTAKWSIEKQKGDSSGQWCFILFIHAGLVAFALHIIAELINLWAWVGIFYPELYAVHKFILN